MNKYRTKQACQVCGKPFYGGQDCHYCPECARNKKLDTVVKIRTCQDCGVEFFGGPRAKRCPDCAYKAGQEAGRRHKKTGTKRPLGSIDKCVICGAEYIVTSGRQKYCSGACRREGVLAWQREHKKGYSKASGQDVKKQMRREAQEKICVYCLRKFKSDNSTNLCSDYCRTEQKRIQMCVADLNRGRKGNYDRLIDLRNQYREAVKNGADLSGYSGSSRTDYQKYADMDMSILTAGEQKVLKARIQKPDMTQKELAELCDMNIGSAASLLSRAIKKLGGGRPGGAKTSPETTSQ